MLWRVLEVVVKFICDFVGRVIFVGWDYDKEFYDGVIDIGVFRLNYEDIFFMDICENLNIGFVFWES